MPEGYVKAVHFATCTLNEDINVGPKLTISGAYAGGGGGFGGVQTNPPFGSELFFFNMCAR